MSSSNAPSTPKPAAPSVPRLAGRTAMVTGGGSGIGLAITRRFVAEGATVVVGDIDDARLADVAAELGPSVHVLHCDVTEEPHVDALCALAISATGRLDVAVANAGRGSFGMITEMDAAEFRSVLDLCVTGVMLTVKHAGRVMADGGSIVTISSLNGTQPSAGMSAYCAAKAAVMMFTKVAAMELGSRRIRVNAIAPGLIETPATGGFFAMPGVVEEFVDNTSLGRFGSPADVAALAAFLASDDSAFISAGVHTVDGGASTGRYPDLPAAIARVTALAAEGSTA